MSNALAPIVPVAVKTTLCDGQIVVLLAFKSIVQPATELLKTEINPTHPVDCEAPLFVNLNVKAPETLFAQNIPGFNSAWTTPPNAGCPVLYGLPEALYAVP